MEMVLPRNYVEIEEMMYLDGGGYKSAAALLVKTATYSVARATVIGAATILSALGASGSLLGAALTLGAITLGIYLLAKDYGFQHQSWSIFALGVHNVKRI